MVGFRKIYILFPALFISVFLLYGTPVHAREVTDILAEAAQEGAIYEVNPDGTGDFVSIQEGVDSVASGDTLLIYPGVYEENVIIENKTVNLVGMGAEYCILTANVDNYHYIPLTVAAGRVYGLTICGTSKKEDDGRAADAILAGMSYDIYDSESIYAWQNMYSGYAIHIDDRYASGKALHIENCRIISEGNYCIGIGCWSNMETTVEDCQLISGGRSGCIFLHNNAIDEGRSQISVRNSQLSTYKGPYIIAVHSEGTINPVDLTFQNVKVSAVAYENNDCYSGTNMNTWFQVEQMENPGVQSFLRTNGYTGLTGSQLVHRGTVEQHIKFNKALTEHRFPLESWPSLDEGITYWERAEKLPLNPEKRCCIIEIKNIEEGVSGDGWCGLSGIYLTEDSYGNTLPEMNYPRPAAVEAVESE